MKGNKHTPGQIIRKLRDAEADLAAGLIAKSFCAISLFIIVSVLIAEDGGAVKNAEEVNPNGLQIELTCHPTTVRFGQPVMVRLAITNLRDEKVAIPLSEAMEWFPGGAKVEPYMASYRPLAPVCATVDPGESLTLEWGEVLPKVGKHELRFGMKADWERAGLGHSYWSGLVQSNKVTVTCIDKPLSKEDAEELQNHLRRFVVDGVRSEYSWDIVRLLTNFVSSQHSYCQRDAAYRGGMASRGCSRGCGCGLALDRCGTV